MALPLLKLQWSVFLLLCSVIANSSFAKESNEKTFLPLKEAKWLANSSNKTKSLTQHLSECLNPQAPAISKLGKIAFESQALLGGQAAKMSLTCASCHPSGRTNPDFFLASISGKPGTADVSHSFFSSTGGNNTLTPVPIPDLAKLEESTIKDRQSDAFRNKLTQLIEIEFDGQKANKEVLDGLQAYLANTDIEFCNEHLLQTITFERDWKQLIETVTTLTEYSNEDTNTFIIRSARKRIEIVYWRFKNINSAEIDNDLIGLSRQLESLSLEKMDHSKQIDELQDWQKSAQQLYTNLNKRRLESTYNPEIINQLLQNSNETTSELSK